MSEDDRLREDSGLRNQKLKLKVTVKFMYSTEIIVKLRPVTAMSYFGLYLNDILLFL